MLDDGTNAPRRGEEIPCDAAPCLDGADADSPRPTGSGTGYCAERCARRRLGDAVGRPARDVGLVEQNTASKGRELAADLVDEAGFAGAVGADDDVPLAPLDRQVHILGHDQAAEGAGKISMRSTLMPAP